METVNQLVFSIIDFLNSQITSNELTEDAVESLEVAKQCLETAYGVTLDDTQLRVSRSLMDIFTTGADLEGATANEPQKQVTLSDKAEAENYKTQGNDLMKVEKFKEALECYSKAIELDPTNAVYYCNRAAALSKLNDHKGAISDCQRAIRIDNDYSKAFGRMGLAYSSLCEYEKARDCYKKASEIDPSNESYIVNLKTAEQKMVECSLGGASSPGAGLGGLDFSSLMANPSIMSMATEIMKSPQMQNMMTGMLRNTQGDAAEGGMNNLFRSTYQLAQQMQQQNPEIVEQLRTQLKDGTPNDQDEEKK